MTPLDFDANMVPLTTGAWGRCRCGEKLHRDVQDRPATGDHPGTVWDTEQQGVRETRQTW